jgi:hypothetical protein
VTAVGLDALDPQTRDHITPLVLVGLLVTMGAAALAGVATARASRRARSASELPHEVLRSAPIPRGDPD